MLPAGGAVQNSKREGEVSVAADLEAMQVAH
jgi:hypothetical protein